MKDPTSNGWRGWALMVMTGVVMALGGFVVGDQTASAELADRVQYLARQQNGTASDVDVLQERTNGMQADISEIKSLVRRIDKRIEGRR